jgi:hypothetical protein
MTTAGLKEVRFRFDFEGTKIGDSGNTIPVRNKAIEVLRRQRVLLDDGRFGIGQ